MMIFSLGIVLRKIPVIPKYSGIKRGTFAAKRLG
jgi:hypothetical protein